MHSPKTTRFHLARARRIVTDPATCAADPGLRRAAWVTLKRAAGQTIRMHRLMDELGEVPSSLHTTLDMACPRIRARVRARAAELGIIAQDGPEGAA